MRFLLSRAARRTILATVIGASLPLLAAAQPAARDSAAAVAGPAAEAPAAPASAASAAAATSDPGSFSRVIEDRQVRIEETVVRGQVQRVVVHSKLRGVKPYEILLDPGRNPALGRGVDGQRAWSVFDF